MDRGAGSRRRESYRLGGSIAAYSRREGRSSRRRLLLRAAHEGPGLNVLCGCCSTSSASEPHEGSVAADDLRNVNRPTVTVHSTGRPIGDGHSKSGAVIAHVHGEPISAVQINARARQITGWYGRHRAVLI